MTIFHSSLLIPHSSLKTSTLLLPTSYLIPEAQEDFAEEETIFTE